MSIPVVCPSCDTRMTAPDTAAGRKVKCKRCQHLLLVPQESASAFTSRPPDPAPSQVRHQPLVQPVEPVAAVLTVACPGCGSHLQVPCAMAGRQVACSKCQTLLNIGGHVAHPVPAPAEEPRPRGRRFSCPACGSTSRPEERSRISAAGWGFLFGFPLLCLVLAPCTMALSFFAMPLAGAGFFMRDPYSLCRDCRERIGG